jgi:hypothetical protein
MIFYRECQQIYANDPAGNRQEVYECVPTASQYGFPYWRNRYTVRYNPREGLVQFIAKCQERGVYVGLSTWFVQSEPNRNERIEGADELVRVWDETLQLLQENDCLKSVIYVDILNEYPYYHGFTWLQKMMDTMKEPKHPERNFNDKQTFFYRNLIDHVIVQLKSKWITLDFFSSQTNNVWEDDKDMDYSQFALLDIHLWLVLCDDFNKDTGYFPHMHEASSDKEWLATHTKMMEKWQRNKAQYVAWMDNKMKVMAQTAEKWRLPLGNTEGWGPIYWEEHPDLEWDFVKEAGEIGAHLGAKYGYAFNCSSNFCHPYFKGMWDDISWHKKVTDIIKGGQKKHADLLQPIEFEL